MNTIEIAGLIFIIILVGLVVGYFTIEDVDDEKD